MEDNLADEHWLSIWNIAISNISRSSTCDVASQIVMLLILWGARHKQTISKGALAWVKGINSGQAIPLTCSTLRMITVLANNAEEMGALTHKEICNLIFKWVTSKWILQDDGALMVTAPEIFNAVKLYFLQSEIDITDIMYLDWSHPHEELASQIRRQNLESFLFTDLNLRLLSVPILYCTDHIKEIHPNNYIPEPVVSHDWFHFRLNCASRRLQGISLDIEMPIPNTLIQSMKQLLLFLVASVNYQSISSHKKLFTDRCRSH